MTSGGGFTFNFGGGGGTNTAPAGTTGGAFSFDFGGGSGGSTTNTTNTATGATGGFGFGDTTSNAAGSSFSFGTPATTTQPSGGTGGSFGFDFGGGGGTNTTTSSNTSAFSFNTPAANTNNFNFGGGGGATGFNPQPAAPQPQGIQADLYKIFHAYKSESALCRFNHFFYNVAESGKAPSIYQEIKKKYPYINAYGWQKAEEQNPDPNKYVPVPVRSCAELEARAQHQKKVAEVFKQSLAVLEKKLLAVQSKHKPEKIDAIKTKHADLSNRLLKVQQKLEVLMQRGIGTSSDDTMLKNKLTAMLRELHKPNQYRGRLNELIPQYTSFVQQVHTSIPDSSIDEENFQQIRKYLELQTSGLETLIKILRKDMKDMTIIMSGVKEAKERQKGKTTLAQNISELSSFHLR